MGDKPTFSFVTPSTTPAVVSSTPTVAAFKEKAEKIMFDDIFDLYEKDGVSEPDRLRLLMLGDTGTGKSGSALTARQPVLMHSFDPTGGDFLRSEGAVFNPRTNPDGFILLDRRFEADTAVGKATIYENWLKTFVEMYNSGAFERFGTYYFDSGTMFIEALMRFILQREKILGSHPRIQDWGTLQTMFFDQLKLILSLPCDVVITGHLDRTTNEITNAVTTGILASKGIASKMPLNFSQMVITEVANNAKGESEYRLLLKADSIYRAKSTAPKDVKRCPNNIKTFLELVKLPTNDLPPIKSWWNEWKGGATA